MRTLKCNVCDKTFMNSTDLKRHRRTHTGEKPFKCDVCGTCFSENRSLVCHLRIHTGAKPFPCDECGMLFRTKSGVYQHKLTHTNVRPFTCDVCSKSFKSRPKLKEHMLVHTTDRQLFRCEECGKTLKTKPGLKYHEETHARKRLLEFDDSDKLSNTDGDLINHEEMLTDDGQLQCTDTFKRKEQVENQDLLHTKQKCLKSNQTGESSLVTQGLKQNDYSDINAVVANVCEYCGKSFKFKYDLKYRHSCRFMVAQCKSAKTPNLRLKRYSRLQNRSKFFKCIVCSKAFFLKKSLLIHIYQHKRTFKCNVCLKLFISKISLRLHKCHNRK